MAVRKIRFIENSTAVRQMESLRLADGSAVYVASPVHALHARLDAVATGRAIAVDDRYPRAARLAILLVVPAALWWSISKALF